MKGNGDLFGAAPITIWDVARSYLGRELLGKLIRDNGEDSVKQATIETLLKIPGDPMTYLMGVLKQRPDDLPVWQLSAEKLYVMAQARGISTLGKTKQDLVNELR